MRAILNNAKGSGQLAWLKSPEDRRDDSAGGSPARYPHDDLHDVAARP
jgi:hypothetical protein